MDDLEYAITWQWLSLAGIALLVGGLLWFLVLTLPPRARFWLLVIGCPVLAFWPLALSFLHRAQ